MPPPDSEPSVMAAVHEFLNAHPGTKQCRINPESWHKLNDESNARTVIYLDGSSHKVPRPKHIFYNGMEVLADYSVPVGEVLEAES